MNSACELISNWRYQNKFQIIIIFNHYFLLSLSLGIKPPSSSCGGVPTENNCTIIRDRSGGGRAVAPARSDGWLRDVTLTVGKTAPSRCSSAWSPGCDAQVRSRMRRSWSWSWSWMGCALCLCASLTGSARDSREDDIMNLWRENGTQPDTGTEPMAEILKCNKVHRTCQKDGNFFK